VIYETSLTRQWCGHLAVGLVLAFGASAAQVAEAPVEGPQQLAALIGEALANNPEIAAARSELDAGRERISTAGALDDPMLEFGVINAPLDPLDLQRDDMTMKMLGLEQRLPFPGKRELRRAVAAADAVSVSLAVQETINRIERDVRVAYEELAFNAEARKIAVRTRVALEQSAEIARSRYEVGQAVQNDVLDAHIELERLDAELLQLTSEDSVLQGEMRRLLGRTGSKSRINAAVSQLAARPVLDADSMDPAIDNRPQLLALQSLVERDESSIELAEREYYPDFDLKLQYGQRDRAPDGVARDDMVSLTVAVNLPIWRKSRLEPQVAEARAMRRKAQNLLMAERLESQATLETQLALAGQWRATAELYQSTLLPQVHAAVTSALAAYRVGQVDFPTLRESQLRESEVLTELARAIANHNKAIAEIDLLVGRSAGVEP
jgi:cobalt-zinc-cadmium efflux system outer membrane protein